jgi:DNA adenine methylase
LKWFGGKHYLAEKIISLRPPHIHYVEPYAGSLAVLLAKDPEGVSEIVNDLNGDLTNFWQVLKNEQTYYQFKRMVEATLFSEAEYQRATSNDSHSLPTWRAWSFFIRCRQSRAGQFKDFATVTRTRTRRQMNEQASAWLTAIEGLPAVHARLKRVVILNRDALDVIRQQDGPNTCFYFDPPYLHETRTSDQVYEQEMTNDQHAQLTSMLQRVKGKVLICGYRSRLYDTNLSKWNRHDFKLPNNVAGGKTKRRMTECVWTNF